MGINRHIPTEKIVSIIGLFCIQFILLAASPAFGQNSTVGGVVKDATNGETLPGVNIIVKGTSTGTSTDSEGHYSLNVHSLSDTLMFSFIGYQTQEVPINDRTEINISLTNKTIGGKEIVVVGYGSEQKKDLTGSISSVDVDNIEAQPVMSPDDALKGQIAGVQVVQTSGVPGGGPQIRVRGPGSISAGSDPLYVVDGFALPNSSSFINNPLNSIPPEDIKSIDVLKDASATAIYGSRGANGVVIIETKSGRAGDTQVSVSTYTGIQTVRDKGLPELLNAREFAEFRKQYYEGQVRFAENREPTAADVPDMYQNPEALGAGTDWLNQITRNAISDNLNVSVSGGSENLTARVSGGYSKQEGIVLGSGYKRYSLRANLDATLNDNLRLGFNLSPTFSNQELVAAGGNGRYEHGFGSAIVASPIPPVYNEDGTYNSMIVSPGAFPYPNPVQTLNEIDNSQSELRAMAGFYAELDFLNNFTFRTTLNGDWDDTKTSNFHPSSVGYLFQNPPVIPNGSYYRGGYLNWQNENTIRYTNDFGNHSINILAGISVQENTANSAGFTGDNYPDNDIKTLNAASKINGGTYMSEWSLVSYLARMNYNFKDKYLVTATVRRDGSSRFGSDNRWGIFPSVAMAWRLTNEPFMNDMDLFDDLKIRASYGVNGNFNIGDFAYTGQLGINNYVLGGTLANGKTLNTIPNPNLGWETTDEYDIGFDATLLDSRLTVSLDLYRRTTRDMLLNVEIPQSSGFSSVLENRGKIQNKGIELSINSRNIQTNDFTWNTDFNIASYANKVLQLGPDGEPILVGNVNAGAHTSIIKVGQPIGMFWGWQFDGIYMSQQEINNDPGAYPDAIPGNVKVRDLSGNGNLVRDEDFKILGNPYPDFTFGLTNSFSYKNFDLRVLLTGSYGGQVMRGANEWLWNIDGVFNVTKDYFDNRYISSDQPGDGHTPTPVGTSQARIFYRDPNNQWIHDSSHIWVKNIKLAYNLPDILGFDLKGAQVYASIQNAFLLSYYNGNPEATNYTGHSGGNAQTMPGIDFNTYPLSRTYTFGLRFTY